MDLSQLWKYLTDNRYLSILYYTSGTSRSVRDISDNLKIPRFKCYRIVKTLQDLNLMEEDHSYHDNGGKTKYFRSQIESFILEYSLGDRKFILNLERDHKLVQMGYPLYS